MKRLATIALALCLAAGATAFSSGTAGALEIQVSGVWDTVFVFRDNYGFQKDDNNDHFLARSRFRPQVEFVASENLRGVVQFQIGSIRWGDRDTGGQLDTNSSSAYTRRAYIDWNVADTRLNLKLGLQHMAFPSAVRGNPFFGGNVAGVLGTIGFNDDVSLSALWGRTFISNGYDDRFKDNQTDLFGLIADFNFEHFTISPWLAYASMGAYSGQWEYGWNYMQGADLPAGSLARAMGWDDETNVFAGGLAVKIAPMDRLSIGIDGAYARADNDGRKHGNRAPEGDGFFAALTVDYALDWGTPGIFGWYSSGDSKSDRRKGKWGRMMNIGMDDGVAMSRLGFMGSYGHGDDTIITATGAGTWGAGLQIADMSFKEKLSHTVRVAYYEGTNAKRGDNEALYPSVVANFGEGVYLTEKDWALEVNLDSKYEIMENFTAVLELGWIHLDLDKKGFEYLERRDVDENAWNAQLILRYAF